MSPSLAYINDHQCSKYHHIEVHTFDVTRKRKHQKFPLQIAIIQSIPFSIMTRACNYRSSNKPSLKRSSPCDFRSTKNSLAFEFTMIPSSPTSASVPCLNTLFGDLCVARTTVRKRNLGRFRLNSRSRRCAHLASLIEQCSSSPSDKILSNGVTEEREEVLTPVPTMYSYSSSSSSSSSSEHERTDICFPFNTRRSVEEVETSATAGGAAWGHFVEAEDEQKLYPVE